MKTLIATIAVLNLVESAKYAPGTVCNTNLECNANCIDAEWNVKITLSDGGWALACTRKIDAAQYHIGTCEVADDISFDTNFDGTKTNTACGTVAGSSSCKDGCLLSGKKSTSGDIERQWKKACQDVQADAASFTLLSDKDVAKQYYGC